jgi:hypothetical protein
MEHVISGHVYRYEGPRGPVWRAKYRLPDGRHKHRTGPVWTQRGRPADGYFTKRTAEGWLRDVLDHVWPVEDWKTFCSRPTTPSRTRPSASRSGETPRTGSSPACEGVRFTRANAGKRFRVWRTPVGSVQK